jgi:hypothetical protein
MKKETILAVVLGVVMGGAVGGVILANTTKSDKKPIQQAAADLAQNTKAAQRTQTSSVSFEIASPTADSTYADDSVTINGKAAKDSLLVIQSPTGTEIMKTEKDSFSVDFPLALGENVINLTLYPSGSENEYLEKTLRVYYLPE